MCKPAQLASYMLTDLFRRGAHGRQVFVVMHGESIEAIVSGDKKANPEAVLHDYCITYGREAAGRRCLPVYVPEGFKAGSECKDFHVLADGNQLRIEFN